MKKLPFKQKALLQASYKKTPYKSPKRKKTSDNNIIIAVTIILAVLVVCIVLFSECCMKPVEPTASSVVSPSPTTATPTVEPTETAPIITTIVTISPPTSSPTLEPTNPPTGDINNIESVVIIFLMSLFIVVSAFLLIIREKIKKND
jgi:hypothetical protein